jgi:hypothetical protein
MTAAVGILPAKAPAKLSMLMLATSSGRSWPASASQANIRLEAIAYMSSLTSPAFAATQYALLSSLYALPGKFVGGRGQARHVGDERRAREGAGEVVDADAGHQQRQVVGHDLPLLVASISIDNFAGAFAGTALIAYMSSLTAAKAGEVRLDM